VGSPSRKAIRSAAFDAAHAAIRGGAARACGGPRGRAARRQCASRLCPDYGDGDCTRDQPGDCEAKRKKPTPQLIELPAPVRGICPRYLAVFCCWCLVFYFGVIDATVVDFYCLVHKIQ